MIDCPSLAAALLPHRRCSHSSRSQLASAASPSSLSASQPQQAQPVAMSRAKRSKLKKAPESAAGFVINITRSDMNEEVRRQWRERGQEGGAEKRAWLGCIRVETAVAVLPRPKLTPFRANSASAACCPLLSCKKPRWRPCARRSLRAKCRKSNAQTGRVTRRAGL